jgi:hypothetical protein
MAIADQYRWRIADCIPFSRSIDVNVECGYAVDGSRWTSVAFWYQLPSHLEDFDDDGDVDFADFAVLASAWMSQTGQPNWNPVCDISSPKDNIINWSDLAIFSEQWLAGRP